MEWAQDEADPWFRGSYAGTAIWGPSRTTSRQPRCGLLSACCVLPQGISTSESLHPIQLHHRPYRTYLLPKMLIKVRTLTGKEIELDIENDYKVSQIKEKVEEKEGIPPAQQRLIYGGKQMVDDKTATEYNLEGGATLHLVLALRGGN
ncbi:hypothetical protein V491_05536 [Pseudogymnoascus sp. VKM F-3775]|nr:hypothetical protein V491_05536 [Pseudogymnoascus sp. VKM F-3775]